MLFGSSKNIGRMKNINVEYTPKFVNRSGKTRIDCTVLNKAFLSNIRKCRLHPILRTINNFQKVYYVLTISFKSHLTFSFDQGKIYLHRSKVLTQLAKYRNC